MKRSKKKKKVITMEIQLKKMMIQVKIQKVKFMRVKVQIMREAKRKMGKVITH